MSKFLELLIKRQILISAVLPGKVFCHRVALDFFPVAFVVE